MKLRIYFRPAFVLLLLGLAAALAWAAAALLTGATCVIAMVIAAFYTVLSVLAGLAVLRLGVLESWQAWDAPGRLLILAPHEDDCVIAAGGIGARNRRLGGVTRIVYLAPDETPGLAERRSTEARAAWSLAGVTGGDIISTCCRRSGHAIPPGCTPPPQPFGRSLTISSPRPWSCRCSKAATSSTT